MFMFLNMSNSTSDEKQSEKLKFSKKKKNLCKIIFFFPRTVIIVIQNWQNMTR